MSGWVKNNSVIKRDLKSIFYKWLTLTNCQKSEKEKHSKFVKTITHSINPSQNLQIQLIIHSLELQEPTL